MPCQGGEYRASVCSVLSLGEYFGDNAEYWGDALRNLSGRGEDGLYFGDDAEYSGDSFPDILLQLSIADGLG